MSDTPRYDPATGKCSGDCDCSPGETCKAYLVYREKHAARYNEEQQAMVESATLAKVAAPQASRAKEPSRVAPAVAAPAQGASEASSAAGGKNSLKE